MDVPTVEEQEEDKDRSYRSGILHTVLIGIFLATLPCYCSGAMLIAFHQEPSVTPTPTMASSITATLWEPSPTYTDTFAPTLSPTPSDTPFAPTNTIKR